MGEIYQDLLVLVFVSMISESTSASCIREGCAFVVILKSSFTVGSVREKRTDKQTMEELSVEVGINEGLSSVSPG